MIKDKRKMKMVSDGVDPENQVRVEAHEDMDIENNSFEDTGSPKADPRQQPDEDEGPRLA